jgi:hypothetical protein
MLVHNRVHCLDLPPTIGLIVEKPDARGKTWLDRFLLPVADPEVDVIGIAKGFLFELAPTLEEPPVRMLDPGDRLQKLPAGPSADVLDQRLMVDGGLPIEAKSIAHILQQVDHLLRVKLQGIQILINRNRNSDVRVRYRAMTTVMGLHLESSKAEVLDSAAYHLTKIHHLLPTPWRTKMTEDTTENTVSNRGWVVFSCRSEALGAEVVCEVLSGRRISFKKGIQIRCVPKITITPQKPQSVDWFTALAFRLENFFALMLGTSVEVKHIQLFQGEQDGWVVKKVNGRKEKIDAQLWVRCKFEDTANALERWLAVPKGILRKRDLYGEMEFLTLAQALEGFGRIRFGGTKRRKVKFDDLIQATYNIFTPAIARQLVGERDAFTTKIIQTRDYYTHRGNPKESSAAKTIKELFLLNKRLHAFLRGAMLIDLAIPEEAFSQAVVHQATKWT